MGKRNIAYFIIFNGRELTQLGAHKFPTNAKDVTKLYASVVDMEASFILSTHISGMVCEPVIWSITHSACELMYI
jgi:hypothetical protein